MTTFLQTVQTLPPQRQQTLRDRRTEGCRGRRERRSVLRPVTFFLQQATATATTVVIAKAQHLLSFSPPPLPIVVIQLWTGRRDSVFFSRKDGGKGKMHPVSRRRQVQCRVEKERERERGYLVVIRGKPIDAQLASLAALLFTSGPGTTTGSLSLLLLLLSAAPLSGNIQTHTQTEPFARQPIGYNQLRLSQFACVFGYVCALCIVFEFCVVTWGKTMN